jgi:hypothetical protein
MTVALGGCSTPAFETRLVADTANNLNGITYYLPMRYAKVTFERTKADSKAAEAATKAKEAVKEKEGALKTAQAAVTAATAYLVAIKAKGFDETTDIYKQGQAELVKSEQDVVGKTVALKKTETERDAAIAAEKAFNNSKPMCGWVDAIKVELLDYVPDTTARYELVTLHEASRADHFKIGTTASGLLKSTDAELKDQTGEILIGLAKSLAARTGAPLVTERTAPVAKPDCENLDWQPISVSAVLDPTVDAKWTAISTGINKAATVNDTGGVPAIYFNYRLVLDPPVRAPASTFTNRPGPASAPTSKTSVDGILYRRERPLVVNATADNTSIGSYVLVVPNKAPSDLLAINATSFVTNDYKLVFENGMLTNLDMTQPSAILEVVSVPWKIAKETLGIVGEIIQLKVDYSTDKTALAEQQVKLVQQMQALIDAQRALDAAKNPPSPKEDDGSEEESEAGATE